MVGILLDMFLIFSEKKKTYPYYSITIQLRTRRTDRIKLYLKLNLVNRYYVCVYAITWVCDLGRSNF